MKFYADTSFLGNLYFPDQHFSRLAKAIQEKYQLTSSISPLVRLEFRLACVRLEAAEAWAEFLADLDTYDFVVLGELWQAAEALAEQKGRAVAPYALDALHVVAAINSGCSHFLSFDSRSRQRAFASACGLKVFPEKLSA